MVCLPIYWDVDPYFFQSCLVFQDQWREFAAKYNCSGGIANRFGDAAVGRLRNYLTHDFLESNATHLLFVDSDLLFSAEQVARILSHGEDVVGGCYPKKKQGQVEWVLNTLDQSEDNPRPDGLIKVKYTGSGFLQVSRRVFETIIQKMGDEIWYCDDADRKTKYDFWRFGTYEYKNSPWRDSAYPNRKFFKRFLSEDWFFCQMARDCGFDIWADTRIMIRHSGHCIYPLQTQMNELNQKAKALEDLALSQGSAGSDSEVIPAPSDPAFHRSVSPTIA